MNDRRSPRTPGRPIFPESVGRRRERWFLVIGAAACGIGKALTMAKKKADAREYVWLQCTETGDLNYRTSVNTKGGLPEGVKEGLKKYCPRLRRHTLHKIKRK